MRPELMEEDEFIHTVMHASRLEALNPGSYLVTAYVSTYDPRTNRVRCIIPSFMEMSTGDMRLTGWIPLWSPVAGNGWGIQYGLHGGATSDNYTVGEQIYLLVLETDTGAYIAGGMTWNPYAATPMPTINPGEIVLKDAKGNLVYLKNDGSINIDGQTTVNISGASVVNITASSAVNVTSQGTVSVTAQGAASVSSSSNVSVTAPSISLGAQGQTLSNLVTSALVSLFNGHTHPVSGGNSGTPNQTMGSGELTSTISGG